MNNDIQPIKPLVDKARTDLANPNWRETYVGHRGSITNLINLANSPSVKKTLLGIKTELVNKYNEYTSSKEKAVYGDGDPPVLAWVEYEGGIKIINQTPTGSGGLGIQENFIQIANNFGNVTAVLGNLTLDEITTNGNTTSNSITVGAITCGNVFLGGTTLDVQGGILADNGTTIYQNGLFTGNLTGIASNATNAGSGGQLYYNNSNQLTDTCSQTYYQDGITLLTDSNQNLYVSSSKYIDINGGSIYDNSTGQTVYQNGLFTGDLTGIASNATNATNAGSGGQLYYSNSNPLTDTNGQTYYQDGITLLMDSNQNLYVSPNQCLNINGGSIYDNSTGQTVYQNGLFTGNLTGTATNATNDINGNEIDTTYATITYVSNNYLSSDGQANLNGALQITTLGQFGIEIINIGPPSDTWYQLYDGTDTIKFGSNGSGQGYFYYTNSDFRIRLSNDAAIYDFNNGDLIAPGNISAGYFIGNGSLLTGITAGNLTAVTSVGNTTTNAITVGGLTMTGNISLGNHSLSTTGNGTNLIGNLSTTGNITAGYLIGNGSQLALIGYGKSLYYVNGNILTTSQGLLQSPAGHAIFDSSGDLLYPAGGYVLSDTSGNLYYYGNAYQCFIDNINNLYYPNGDTLIDGGTNCLYASNGGGGGVPGISVTITTAKLTLAGSQGSMTFTNGLLTAQTPAT